MTETKNGPHLHLLELDLDYTDSMAQRQWRAAVGPSRTSEQLLMLPIYFRVKEMVFRVGYYAQKRFQNPQELNLNKIELEN